MQLNTKALGRLIAWDAVPFIACLACSQGDEELLRAEGSDDLDGQSELTETGDSADPAAAGNLSPQARDALTAMAADMLGRLDADRSAANDDGIASQIGENGEREVETGTETVDARTAWALFLDATHQNPEGSFAIGDMFIQDESQLFEMFEAMYTTTVDKGLTLPTRAWAAGSRALSVCWTPNSSATAAEKQRVAQLVQARWATVSDVTFDFGTLPNLRTCTEAPCGLLTCATGSDEVRIYQHSQITRGCAAIGTLQTNQSSLNCGFGVFHDYASIYLPTDAAGTPVFSDYTAVHEFGHAMGILHEQGRTDYNYRTAGARNCASADTEQTVPGSTPPTRVAAIAGQSTFGSTYDDFSIMNYCQQEENLNGDYTDPRMSEISVGDIFSARSMYTAPSSPVTVRYSSWMPASVQLTVQSTNFTVSSSVSPASFNSGIQRVAGDTYTVVATALGGSRLRCFARGRAPGVFNNPQVSPPGGFGSSPAVAECYDPAGLTAVVARML